VKEIQNVSNFQFNFDKKMHFSEPELKPFFSWRTMLENSFERIYLDTTWGWPA
jgi:hypothetical protein